MSLSRIKQDYERIAENFSATSHLLCMCSCRYLELELTDNEDMSEEKRRIFDDNNLCRDDPTNEQIGFRWVEVCEVESSDLSDYDYEN